MVYIVIILVIIMLISPIAWMRPSPRQKQLVRLRECAGKQHLQVSIRRLSDKLQRRHDSPNMACYLKHHARAKANNVKQRPKWFVSVVGEFEWISRKDCARASQLKQICSHLPDGCCYLEAEQDFVGVYWLEKGDEDRVDKIAKVINDVMQLQNQ